MSGTIGGIPIDPESGRPKAYYWMGRAVEAAAQAEAAAENNLLKSAACLAQLSMAYSAIAANEMMGRGRA